MALDNPIITCKNCGKQFGELPYTASSAYDPETCSVACTQKWRMKHDTIAPAKESANGG